jgi:hypothetical protein
MIPLSFTLNSLKDKIYWKTGDLDNLYILENNLTGIEYLCWLAKKIVNFYVILFGVQLNILILTKKNLISRLAVQTRCWRIDVMEEKVVCPVRICSLLPSQSWWYCTLGFDSSPFIQNKSRHVNFDYLLFFRFLWQNIARFVCLLPGIRTLILRAHCT